MRRLYLYQPYVNLNFDTFLEYSLPIPSVCRCLTFHSPVSPQDDELRDMLHSAARLEFHYGHLFDETIVNDDLSTAVAQLLRTARRVETEPLWVPASWVQ